MASTVGPIAEEIVALTVGPIAVEIVGLVGLGIPLASLASAATQTWTGRGATWAGQTVVAPQVVRALVKAARWVGAVPLQPPALAGGP